MDNLNARESFDIITESINNAKVNIKGQIYYYLLWGWLALVSAIFDYGLLKLGETEFHFIPWLLMMPIGWIGTIIYSRKRTDETGYTTQIETFLKNLWIVLGLSMIIVVFISVQSRINPSILTLTIAGIGTLVSGFTIKYRPLIIGGLLFFLFSLITLYIRDENAYLIYSLAIALGYLIPAYKLKREVYV